MLAPFKMLYSALDWLSRYITPARFLAFSGLMLPWLWAAAGLFAIAGLYMGLLASPGEAYQGQTVRIMYVHVPAAWLAMMGYTMIFLSSVGGLIFRNPLADVAAKTAAPIGAAFTLQALVTGAIWGKPTWGAYWAWDYRLTSFLILFFLYLGLIAIWQAVEEHSKAGRAAAILAIVGSVNIPIIHFSVVWWNGLHQGASILRPGGPAISAEFLWPLFLMMGAFTALFFALHLTAMRSEMARRRIASMQSRRADQSAAAPVEAAVGQTS